MDNLLFAAEMDPGWRRWLPCGLALLTVVPDPERFKRSAWAPVLPWDDMIWCDPGDVSEWVSRIAEHHPDWTADQVATHAEGAYVEGIKRRSVRIEQFAEICRRAGLPVPRTVRELFTFCTHLGLFEIDQPGDVDPWVRPMLMRNPLDVLPLTREETTHEAGDQWDDRITILAMFLAHLVEGQEGDRRTVAVSLQKIMQASGESAGRLRIAFGNLCDRAFTIGVDPIAVAVDEPFPVTVHWQGFHDHYPHGHLPPPEHDL